MDATTNGARAPDATRTHEQLVTELARYVDDELAARASGMWL